MNNNKLCNSVSKTMNQLLDEIQRSIKTSVLDNSVGVAFSGGVDSTLVAKLLHDAGYDIHLLTIGFHDSHDINFAKEVNEILKFKHNILEIEPKSFQETSEKIHDIIKTDNLSWNENSIAFYYVSKLAKSLGISVPELFGGPTRDKVRVYWSHCGTSRTRNYDLIGVPPLETWDDITALGREVVDRGFTALKTNVIGPGRPAQHFGSGFGSGKGSTDQVVTKGVLRHIEQLIGTFRDAVGPDVDINLDLNFHFKTEACLRIAQVLEQFDMLWLEIDMYQPESIRQIKDSTTTRICTGENLFYMRDYLPYFQQHAADMFMICLLYTSPSPRDS